MADKKLIVAFGADTSELEKKAKTATSDVVEFADISKMSIGKLQEAINELEDSDWSLLSEQEKQDQMERLAKLRLAYKSLDETVESMAMTAGQRFAETTSSVIDMGSGVAAAYTMMGGSEEEMNKIMQKTIALMAISQGAQEAALFFSQNAYGVFIKNKTKELAAWLTQKLTIDSATVSAGIFNKVIAQNPILWLVAGVAALAVGVYALSTAMDDSASRAENLRSAIGGLKTEMEDTEAWNNFSGAIRGALGTSDLDGMRARRTELWKEKFQVEALIDKYDELKQTGKATDEEIKAREELSKKLVQIGDDLIVNRLSINKKIADDEKAKAEEAKKKAEELRKKREEEAKKEAAARMALGAEEADRLAAQEKNYLQNKLVFNQEYYDALRNKQEEEQRRPFLMKPKLDIHAQMDEVIVDEPAPIQLKKPILAKGEIDFGSMLADAATTFATSLGEAIGSGDWSNFGDNILKSIAGFIQKIGSMLIQFGLAMAVFQFSMNPYAMIAAGTALVIIGAAISGAVSTSSKSAAAGGSSGGGGGGSSWSVERAGVNFSDMAANVMFTIKGNDLVGVLNNESNRRNNY